MISKKLLKLISLGLLSTSLFIVSDIKDVKASEVNSEVTNNEIYKYGQLSYEISNNHIIITDCDKNVEEIDIPESINGYSVTTIAESAFALCNKLKTVSIPSSVKEIGSYAFKGCYSLKSIKIPEGVTEINKATFSFCTSLNSVVLPSTLIKINDSAYSHCMNLEEITIPKNVISIGNSAFFNCYNMKNVKIYNDNVEIGLDAFRIDEVSRQSDRVIYANVGSTAQKYACDSDEFEFNKLADTEEPSISYSAHVQKIGWQGYAFDGALAGTVGQGKRLEGIKINISGDSNLGVKYSAHVQKIGWQGYAFDGALAGTVGQGKRVEAIKIELTGKDKDKYDVYYKAQVQSYGWLDWVKNGEISGTVGKSKRLEAIQIKLVKKDINN